MRYSPRGNGVVRIIEADEGGKDLERPDEAAQLTVGRIPLREQLVLLGLADHRTLGVCVR